MPKFFCDYCDVYLTHDSMSVRKAHNNGRNHLRNVQAYYEQISSDQTQQVINSITDAYNTEGQANPLFQQNLNGGFPGGPMGGMPGMPPMGMPGFPPPGTNAAMAGMPPQFMGRGGRNAHASQRNAAFPSAQRYASRPWWCASKHAPFPPPHMGGGPPPQGMPPFPFPPPGNAGSPPGGMPFPPPGGMPMPPGGPPGGPPGRYPPGPPGR
ncbi:U1 zinc finger-domain-containing protein [Bipolaris maydis]|nr:U1 zinc finger-domain-containing protein [Bipolaris maydis]